MHGELWPERVFKSKTAGAATSVSAAEGPQWAHHPTTRCNGWRCGMRSASAAAKYGASAAKSAVKYGMKCVLAGQNTVCRLTLTEGYCPSGLRNVEGKRDRSGTPIGPRQSCAAVSQPWGFSGRPDLLG